MMSIRRRRHFRIQMQDGTDYCRQLDFGLFADHGEEAVAVKHHPETPHLKRIFGMQKWKERTLIKQEKK